ncbi:hypothetical protein Calle1_71 [Cellulophaga phage Calle_1]|uniref:Uncharacterized protein n=1 Tax=Cellulophaga phage Calle_1 TaxID=2745643 RepID=A0A8E4ZEE5_9CAUD|nr:hypothetical protein M1M22_gp044 [Cellulophaga phage Calle_1]QQV89744.1 hypothetical protein Calle1_71 [Cellulophaga phage Calle_1]QQV89845.1 hypothetical protein Calle2_71 [Cellulophaga phage Calle_2]QQV89874.1 hypothetical protein Calle3_71 [Cellulophaga phage Calle_3]
MKDDIKTLIGYLESYNESFKVSSMYLMSKEEDMEMKSKIDEIKKRNKIK